MSRRNEASPALNFPVLRPVETFPEPNFEGVPQSADSWFEMHKRGILQRVVAASDDVRLNRTIGVSMLSHAWDSALFMEDERRRGADDADRLFLITWLQHWLTFTGLITASDARTIQILSENGHRGMVLRHFGQLYRKPDVIQTNEQISEKVHGPEFARKKKGVFLGSFDPPGWHHLAVANWYHQFCDHLILGIDSDELAKRRKGEGHPRYSFRDRHAVWSAFPNIVDDIIDVPKEVYDGFRYNRRAIRDLYKSMGADIVFFWGDEPGSAKRRKEIREAGATPFDSDLFHAGKVFSSSQIMEIKEAKLPWFTPLLGR